MVFAWKANGDLVHDFHGDADGASAETAQSYDKEPHRQANGSFVAPFSGIHGWFWENPGDEPVTITLTTAGFYTSAHEFHMDRKRFRHDVGPPSLLTTPGASAFGEPSADRRSFSGGWSARQVPAQPERVK